MSNIEAYFECHYFKSGFKSIFIGDNQRPVFLPSPDSVGLSNVVQLKSTDYAVEVVRRDVGTKLTWIGVYKASVDLDYGDRGNYSGIGVWIVDYTPIHIDALIKSLLNLLKFIGNAEPTDEFISRVKVFHSDYLDKFLISNLSMPSGFCGMPFFKDRYDLNKYIRIETNSEHSQAMLSNSLISMLFSKNAIEHNRIFYLVGNSSKSNLSSIEDISLSIDVANHEGIIKSLLTYNSEAVARDKAFEQKNIDLLNEKDQLAQSNSILSSEAEKYRTQINNLQREILEHKNKINSNNSNNTSADLSNKIDMLINKSSFTTARLEAIEKKLGIIEKGFASSNASTPDISNSSESNDSYVISIFGLMKRHNRKIIILVMTLALLSLLIYLGINYFNQNNVSLVESRPSNSVENSNDE